MDAQGWLEADDPEPMFRFLDEIGEGKVLWRFALLCLDQVGGHFDDDAVAALDLLGEPDSRMVPALDAARAAARFVASAWASKNPTAKTCALAALESLVMGEARTEMRNKAEKSIASGSVNPEQYKHERAVQCAVLRDLVDPFARFRRVGARMAS